MCVCTCDDQSGLQFFTAVFQRRAPPPDANSTATSVSNNNNKSASARVLWSRAFAAHPTGIKFLMQSFTRRMRIHGGDDGRWDVVDWCAQHDLIGCTSLLYLTKNFSTRST